MQPLHHSLILLLILLDWDHCHILAGEGIGQVGLYGLQPSLHRLRAAKLGYFLKYLLAKNLI
jgi:hypothetical protein